MTPSASNPAISAADDKSVISNNKSVSNYNFKANEEVSNRNTIE